MSEKNNKKLNYQLVQCLFDEKMPTNIKLKKMDYIIRLGASVDAKYVAGYSLLSLAKFMGDEEVISFLEERGASFEIVPNKEELGEFFKVASVNKINKFLRVLPDGYVLDCNVDLLIYSNKLPDFSRVIVNGYFNCSNNNLKSLKGSPREVGEYFCCRNNKLETLEGAPRVVGGDFYCQSNPLKDFEGKPDVIGGKFKGPSIQSINKTYETIDR